MSSELEVSQMEKKPEFGDMVRIGKTPLMKRKKWNGALGLVASVQTSGIAVASNCGLLVIPHGHVTVIKSHTIF